ncbi:MAG: hypothetical protein ABIN24_13475 [Dyadobacter sp.]
MVLTESYINFIHNHFIVSLAVFITVIPLILIFYRKANIDPSFYLLQIYLITKFIIDLIMFHYATQRTNNLMYYNLSIPLRYALLSGMFYYKIDSAIYKRGIIYSIIGFTTFTIWDVVYSNPDINDLHNHSMVAYATTVECLLMLFWILAYFYEIIRMLKIPNLLTFPFFWVCSGLLLYYSSFIFIAPILHYTEKWENPLYIGFLNLVPYIFETLCLLFFSIGVWIFSTRYYAKQ